MKKRLLLLKIIALSILILILVSFIVGFLYSEEAKQVINEKLGAYGYVALFLIPFIIESTVNYISPHVILISSALFGYVLLSSILFVCLGSIIGSIFGFEIGRIFGVRIISKISTKSKVTKIKNIMNNKGLWGISIAAISPLPYFPIVIGSLNVSRKNFLIFGVIPRTISIIVTGLVVYFIL